jgi:hypothetical protein
MAEREQDRFWIGTEVICSHCGHRNVLTEDFPIVVLKRMRSQGIVSIGFACENCQTRHIVKQDRAAFHPPLPVPVPRRGHRSSRPPPQT